MHQLTQTASALSFVLASSAAFAANRDPAQARAVNGLYIEAMGWDDVRLATELFKEATAAIVGCPAGAMMVGAFVLAENLPMCLNKIPDVVGSFAFPKEYTKEMAKVFSNVKKPAEHEKFAMELGGGPLAVGFMRFYGWVYDKPFSKEQLDAAWNHNYASSNAAYEAIMGRNGHCERAGKRALVLGEVARDRAQGIDRRFDRDPQSVNKPVFLKAAGEK